MQRFKMASGYGRTLCSGIRSLARAAKKALPVGDGLCFANGRNEGNTQPDQRGVSWFKHVATRGSDWDSHRRLTAIGNSVEFRVEAAVYISGGSS